MNYTQLQKEIKNGILSSAYLFVCTDSYIANSYVNLIKKTFVNPEFASMNLIVVDDAKPSPQELRAEFDNLPIMADRRIIIIKQQAYQYISQNPKYADTISEYLKSPNPFCTVILMTNKIDKRTKLYKVLEEAGKVVTFDRLKRNELAKYIQDNFTKQKLTISKEAVNYFVQAVDYNGREAVIDLGYVVNEINKLCIYVKGKKNVTLEDVKKVLSPNLNNDIFTYSDYLLIGSIKEALESLQGLLSNKIPIPMIISSLNKTLKGNAISKACADKGMKDFQIAKKHELHEFVVRKYINDSKLSMEKSLQAIKILNEMDMKIKLGQMKSEVAMYIITERICSLV